MLYGSTGIIIRSIYLLLVAMMVTWCLFTFTIQAALIILVVGWLFDFILDDFLEVFF